MTTQLILQGCSWAWDSASSPKPQHVCCFLGASVRLFHTLPFPLQLRCRGAIHTFLSVEDMCRCPQYRFLFLPICTLLCFRWCLESRNSIHRHVPTHTYQYPSASSAATVLFRFLHALRFLGLTPPTLYTQRSSCT